jgi:N-methylhydantoinase A
MIEIGAGGGSIARVDQFGLVKVGPQSAGAQPGPACYAQGGQEPTVTDADLLLGYLDPHFFLGGRLRLDLDAARRAIAERVGAPLGLDPIAAAWAIHQVVNENMAAAARMHAVERGKDVRAFPLFAFGGAGPLHAERVATILGVRELLCPFAAGVGSTLGFLTAPLAFDFVRSHYGLLDQLDWPAIDALYAEMEAEGRRLLAESGVAPADVTIERSADMRLFGQAHQIVVPVPAGSLAEAGPQRLPAAFEDAYRALYKRTAPGVAVEAMSWRVHVSGPPPRLTLHPASANGAAQQVEHAQHPVRADAGAAGAAVAPDPANKPSAAATGGAVKGLRPVYFPELGGFHPTPIYDRYRLRPGDRFAGPAVVEERESTALVGPGATAAVDDYLNLVVHLATPGA